MSASAVIKKKSVSRLRRIFLFYNLKIFLFLREILIGNYIMK